MTARTATRPVLSAAAVVAATATAVAGLGVTNAAASTGTLDLQTAPRVELQQPGFAVAGATYKVAGRLVNTGRSNDKTVVLQWRSSGGWNHLATKKRQDDGTFRFFFSSEEVGKVRFRAVVTRGGRVLDRSPSRTLTVVDAPTDPVDTDTAQPGESGPASNLGTTNVYTMRDFLNAVMSDVSGFWTGVWAQYGYAEPTLRWWFPAPGEPIYHACSPTGTYANDSAAYYCPANDFAIISQQMAIDIWNGQRSSTSGGWTGQAAGDFSVAFVVAHEFAHNLQHEPVLDLAGALLPPKALELHADCWAGVWANSAYYRGTLHAGDIEEALGVAAQFGDTNYWSPTHHGTPEERQRAFMVGYNSGQPPACNVFLK